MEWSLDHILSLAFEAPKDLRIRFELDFEEFYLYSSIESVLTRLVNEPIVLFYGADINAVLFTVNQWITERSTLGGQAGVNVKIINLIGTKDHQSMCSVINGSLITGQQLICVGDYEVYEDHRSSNNNIAFVHMYSADDTLFFKMAITYKESSYTTWLHIDSEYSRYLLISPDAIVSRIGFERSLNQAIKDQDYWWAYVTLKMIMHQATYQHLFSIFMPYLGQLLCTVNSKDTVISTITFDINSRIGEFINMISSSYSSDNEIILGLSDVYHSMNENEQKDWMMRYSPIKTTHQLMKSLCELVDDICFDTGNDNLLQLSIEELKPNLPLSSAFFDSYLEMIFPRIYESLNKIEFTNYSLSDIHLRSIYLLIRLNDEIGDLRPFTEAYWKMKSRFISN